MVATVRALKFHEGAVVATSNARTPRRYVRASPNLERHVRTLQEVFGQRVVVAINRFAADTEGEIRAIEEAMEARGVAVVLSNHFAHGGAGATDLAHAVMGALANPSRTRYRYDESMSLAEKAEQVARRVYWGGGVASLLRRREGNCHVWRSRAGATFRCASPRLRNSSQPTRRSWVLRGFRGADSRGQFPAGAGFVVLISGTIMTMPGLPQRLWPVTYLSRRDGVIHGMR